MDPQKKIHRVSHNAMGAKHKSHVLWETSAGSFETEERGQKILEIVL